MIVLDATIVNIALPSIQRALGLLATGRSWVLNAYTLAFGGLLLLGGRGGDLFGRRRMFIAGCADLRRRVWPVASHTRRGCFARGRCRARRAIASPTALALITTTFAEGAGAQPRVRRLRRRLGGRRGDRLLLGGMLTEWLSWRWVLFVNVPIGVALAIATPVRPAGERARRRPLDLPGALTSTVGVVAAWCTGSSTRASRRLERP